jgi:hypothetical protein
LRLGPGTARWRLPTIKELSTIVDFAVDPSITGFATDPSLFPTIASVLWSSTLTPQTPPGAWALRYDGTNYPFPTDSLTGTGVRCVR